MLRRTLLILSSFFWAAPMNAVVGASYLESPEGVRSSALGGAYGAVEGSAEAQWYNPAGLSGLDGAELSLTHQNDDDGLSSDHIVLGAFLGWQHSFGLMYDRQGAEDTYRDDFGNIGGSFEDSDSVLGLGYAYDLGWLSLGIEEKYLSENIEKFSGSSLATDLGLQGKINRDQVLYGLSLQNLGSAPSLGGPPTTLPTSLRTSLGWQIGEPTQTLLLLGDYNYIVSTSVGTLALGAEYSETYDQSSLALRAGWNFGQNEVGGLTGLNLGAGFTYKFLGIDYTWSPMDVLGNSQRIALTLSYDQKSREQEQSVADYLQINNSSPAPAATPGPTPLTLPTPLEHHRHAGAELEALLAATPTPMSAPTPEILAVPKEKPRGIIGAILSFFSGSTKKEHPAQVAPQGGILRNLFNLFGVSGNDNQAPILPNQQGTARPSGSEDSFVTPVPTSPPQDGQSGQAQPQPTPTMQTTPVIQKMKGWLSF